MRARESATALAAVFANPALRRAQLAWGGSIAAEWAHFVALGVFAYGHGGAVAVGVAGLVRMLPAAIVAPVAATVGDRWRRERFVLAIAVAGACALAGSAVAFYAFDAAVAVYALAAAVGITTTLFRPAHQALLPSLARTPRELIAANGATSTVESLGTLVGPVAAGVLVAVADPGAVFVAGTAALVGAAALLLGIRVDARPAASAPRRSRREELAVGFVTLATDRDALLITALMKAQAFVRGCLNVLIVVVALEVLSAGEGMVGYLTAALGVGGLVGAFAAATLEGRRLTVPLALALVFWGLPIALVAPVPEVVTALVLLAVVGAANSVEDVAGFTLLQRLVPDAALARTLGVFWGASMAAVGAGSIVAPLVVEALGPRAALIVVGGLLPVVTALSWPRLRAVDARTAPAPELELVQAVDLFAPLSIAAKERLARALVPIAVETGDVVIRRGETGDRFYVLDSGSLDVDAGERRRTLGQHGDYVGEIALLRDVPRTATVTATAPSRLLALDRDAFLAAIGGHAEARAAAHAVAEQRLAGTA